MAATQTTLRIGLLFGLTLATCLVCGNVQAQVADIINAIQLQQAPQTPQKLAEEYLNHIQTEEASFLTKVCELTAEQKDKLKELAKDLVPKASKALQRGNSPVVFGVNDAIQVQIGNAGTMFSRTAVTKFRDQLRSKYKETLTAEQQTKYQAEIEARIEFARHANTECLIQIIDSRLMLQPDQIQSLRESLRGWEDANQLMLSYFFHENAENNIPVIPDKLIKPFLNAEQWKVYMAMEKVQVQKHEIVGNAQQFLW